MNISIAMCTYNGERHLRSQLESIAQQTVSAGEIVICDDGSTDATLSIVGEFAQNALCKVRIYKNKQNLGYTKNFEQAIALCQGDLIALSDQDDIWYPHKLGVLQSVFLKDERVGGVFSDGDIINADSASTGRTIWKSHGFNRKEQKEMQCGNGANVLFRHNVVTGMTLMFRSTLRDKLLPIPKSWVHDGWLAFMLVLHSRLAASSDRLIQYRIHSSQQIGTSLSTPQKLRWIAGHGVRAFMERSRSRNLAEYAKAALQFDDLTTYLRQERGHLEPHFLADASARTEYTRAILSAFSRTRMKRVKEILHYSHEYQKYSFMKVLLRDLII
jgi:glycosyltransferase involved in cell wall biosynthesis